MCIVGCNPRFSFSQKSCVRGPAFLPLDYKNYDSLLLDNNKDLLLENKNQKRYALDEVAGTKKNKNHELFKDLAENKIKKQHSVHNVAPNVDKMMLENHEEPIESASGDPADRNKHVKFTENDHQDYFQYANHNRELFASHRIVLEGYKDKRDSLLDSSAKTLHSTFSESNVYEYRFVQKPYSLGNAEFGSYSSSSSNHNNNGGTAGTSNNDDGTAITGARSTGKNPLVASSFAGDSIALSGTNILPWTEYLLTPDSQKAKLHWDTVDFTYSGIVKMFEGDETENVDHMYLSMPKRTSGSLLTTTRSLLYGRIGVRLKAARGRGVVTSIVLFSNVHDEIDFEFIGGELLNTQTNYYHQGELVHTRMVKANTVTSIFENWHYYEIDWNPDRIHWLIDGRIVRTLQKSDTWDPIGKFHKYPQTPMKLHVSIWPGGSESNAPGTIDWAGGLVEWDSAEDIIERGEFYCKLQSLSVEPFINKQMLDFKRDSRKKNKQLPDQRLGYQFHPADSAHGFMGENIVLTRQPIDHLAGFKSTGEQQSI